MNNEAEARAAVGKAAIGAVIFDMDGVLIDSCAAHLESWRAMAAEWGRQIPRERFLATFGLRNPDVIHLLLGTGFSAAEMERMAERKETLYRELVTGRMPAMRGAVELLRQLAGDGLKLAVGSSGPPANVELALREMGVRQLFGAVITGADVTRGKPDPQVFALAADRLGVGPASCVVVEDAPAGVQAARAAGMAVVALIGTYPAEGLAAANLVVGGLDELTPAVIRGLGRRSG